jgi:hypothetical protein
MGYFNDVWISDVGLENIENLVEDVSGWPIPLVEFERLTFPVYRCCDSQKSNRKYD